MGTLILYATKSGATSECADLLAQKIKCVADDLGKTVPDISSFETVIIGSGIRMGKIYKPVDINPETVKAATTVIVVLPIIMVYPFLQKYFVKGIMVGAVTG